ncbi:MAG: hypothetical protein RPU37_13945 [Candidatus Sedimenticola sp. (ex Thyasira tokunagai)]
MSIDRNDNKDVCLRCSPPKAYPCNQRIPTLKARAHGNLPGGTAPPLPAMESEARAGNPR